MSQASDRDWKSNPPKTKEEYAEFKRYQNMIDYFKGFGKIDTTEIDAINEDMKKDDEDWIANPPKTKEEWEEFGKDYIREFEELESQSFSELKELLDAFSEGKILCEFHYSTMAYLVGYRPRTEQDLLDKQKKELAEEEFKYEGKE